MGKRICRILFGIVFMFLCMFTIWEQTYADENMVPKSRIVLNIEKDEVTTENAVVHATLYTQDEYYNRIEKVGIIVSRDGQEIKRLEREVNRKEVKMELTYDLKKDLGLKLQEDTVYQYQIYAKVNLFEAEFSAVGEIQTLKETPDGKTTSAILQMVDENTNEVFRTRIVRDLTVGDSYTYEPDSIKIEYDGQYDIIDGYYYELQDDTRGFRISSLSENMQENVIRLSYQVQPYLGRVRLYLIIDRMDTRTNECFAKESRRLPDAMIRTLVLQPYEFQPEDVYTAKDGTVYMYDSRNAGNDLEAFEQDKYTYMSEEFKTVKVYYTKTDTLPTGTSVTVEHRDAATDELIKTETLENQKIGASYTYAPSKEAFSYGKYYSCTYAPEDKRNVLSYEALWTNPANNVITVYYKTVKKTDFNQSGVKVSVADVTYNGRTQKPEVKVTYAGKTLKEGEDYTVVYQNNKKIGRGIVTIKAKENSRYFGECTAEFLIRPKKTKLRSVVPKGTHKALVKLQKVKGVSGYEISYSADRKFRKAKTKSTTKTSLVLKKLQAGKKYYFRVRSYKKVKGEKIYSAYSKAVKVEMKQ